MAKPNDTKVQAAVDDDMVEWQGEFGGNVDGWWSPPPEATSTIKGILVNFIDKARSEKLQSNSLVFELTEDAEFVKNGGSDRVPGKKGDGKLHKVGKGASIAVPEWKLLVGLWPSKAGHEVAIERGPRRDIGKGRKMYDMPNKPRVSKTKRREIEVSEVHGVSDAAAETAGDPTFQTDAEA
jgi:hypothetical protein